MYLQYRIVWFAVVAGLIIGLAPAAAQADRRPTDRIGETTEWAEAEENPRYVVASARHGRSHPGRLDLRASRPYGKAYGYYGKSKHRHHRHLRKHHRHQRVIYDYYPTINYYRYRPPVGIRACFSGSDGFFCFNSRY